MATAGNAQAGLLTFIGNEAGWLSQMSTSGLSVTGTENFNGFASDVDFNNSTLNLPLFSITASAGNGSFNKIDVPPYANGQANQDGTPSFLGLENVTIDFTDNLAALAFGYLDSGAASVQAYDLQVNFAGGGNSTFSLGNPNPETFVGMVATGGMLIESVTWLLPDTPSPFSVDNILLSAAASEVPAPGAFAILGIGLAGLSLARRSRTARRARLLSSASAALQHGDSA